MGHLKEHEPAQAAMLTMCAAPDQMLDIRWTLKPFDICSSWCPLHSRGASQSEIRQIHRGLDRLFHLYE